MCGLHVELLHTHFSKPNGIMFHFVNNFFYRNWFLLTWVKLLSRATLLHSTDYICFRGFGVTTISPKLRCLRLTSSSVILTKMHCFLGFYMNLPGKAPQKQSNSLCFTTVFSYKSVTSPVPWISFFTCTGVPKILWHERTRYRGKSMDMNAMGIKISQFS